MRRVVSKIDALAIRTASRITRTRLFADAFLARSVQATSKLPRLPLIDLAIAIIVEAVTDLFSITAADADIAGLGDARLASPAGHTIIIRMAIRGADIADLGARADEALAIGVR